MNKRLSQKNRSIAASLRDAKYQYNKIKKDETMDKMIVVDIEKCLGCHSCELACAVAHSKSKDLFKAIYEEPRSVPRIILEDYENNTVPIHCRHCEDAPCVTVCPTGAISRPTPDSPVTLDSDKCIGCHACIMVCPFGVIQINPYGKSVIKCDLCFERLENGQEPACAEACKTGAIKFVAIKDVSLGRREEYMKKYKVAIQNAENLRE